MRAGAMKEEKKIRKKIKIEDLLPSRSNNK